MVEYLSRAAAGLRPPKGSVPLNPSETVGVALHWPGMAKPINAVGDVGRRRVASALRGWQNFHMDVRGWSDIAYQVAVDQVGRAWTLRGINIRSGANGDGTVNRRYGAILLVLAPGELPSAAMKATVRAIMLDYRKRLPKVALKPKGHKDVREDGTDCPGPLAYDDIQDGEFTPGIANPPSTQPPKEDDMTPTQLDNLKAYIDTRQSKYALWSNMRRTADELALSKVRGEPRAVTDLLSKQATAAEAAWRAKR